MDAMVSVTGGDEESFYNAVELDTIRSSSVSAPVTEASTDPFIAATRGDVDFFEAIEVDIIKNSRDEINSSVLSVASIYGHLNCCQVIYRRCPELLYHSNNRKHTALHEAAYNGENDIIKFLLSTSVGEDTKIGENGGKAIDYKLLMMVNTVNETALNSAVARGKVQSAKLLLEADHKKELFKVVNSSKKTALHVAVQNHDLEMVKLLMEIDSDFIYPPDTSGETPLIQALEESFLGNENAGARGWTLLHYAASIGDLSSIEDIFQFCPECAGLVDTEHQNFLHLATKFEHERIVQYIMTITTIDEGVLNGQDIHGNTPLHIATSRGYAGMGLALLYNPRVKKQILNKQGRNALAAIDFEYDKTRAGVYDPILSAKRGDVDFFEAIEVDVIKNSRDDRGASVLSIASIYGHLNCCEVFYRRCPELLYHQNNEGFSALHEAAYNGENEIIKFLLSASVVREDIESGQQAVHHKLLMMVNTSLETALHSAVIRGKVQSAKLLLETDQNNELFKMMNISNRTALHLAVDKHDLEMVKLLVEIDQNFTYPADVTGETPLYQALQESISGDETAVAIRRILIEKLSSQCKLPIGVKGWTLIHHAANIGDLGSIEDIIQFSPECLALVDSEGQNFLHLATKFEHVNIVRHIMGLTDIDDIVLNGQDIQGNTPLHIATSRGHSGMGLALLYNPKVKKLLLNEQGRNALEAINFEYDKRRAGVYGYVQRLDEKDLKDRSDFDLLVGALISTVSFTAGITVPGGYFSDAPYQGNAVLYKKRSFQAFVVSNTIALVLSLHAVFSHFCTRRLISEASIVSQLKVATYCSLGAIFAMVVAFITGSYAVLAISDELAITVCVICCCFFIFSFRAMLRMIREQRQRHRPSPGGENWLWFLGLNN